MTAALAWTRARPVGACFAAELAGAVLARYGLGAAGLIAAFTTGVLVVLSVIDAETHRLPNHIVPAVRGCGACGPARDCS